MKKIPMLLVGMAPLCVLAQGSVTLFGVVDTGVAYVKAGGKSVTALTNSGASYSRLGFRGSEDLGGGLKAGFWLEAPLSGDTGQGLNPATGFNFARRATVSFAGSFGELRLGQDYTASYYNPAWFDPFQGTGIGQPTAFMMLGSPIRIGNAVSYFLPRSLGGLHGQLQYAFGEEPSGSTNSKKGNYLGIRAGYSDARMNLAVSASQYHSGTATAASRIDSMSVVGTYDLGVIKPMAFWASEKNSSGARIDAYLVGATAPLGPMGELRATYSYYDRKSSGNDWTKLSLGYLHNLSKRTALYGTYARIDNRGGSTQIITTTGFGNAPISQPLTNRPGASSSGLEFGIRHIF
ncbi:MAG: porin [Burkholderiaceae bacterium]|jgi:predicted porin|nr:porin [Burkholderiaceae bacterium]